MTISQTDFSSIITEAKSESTRLPTMYDLPSEDPDEPGWADFYHVEQSDLLAKTCQSPINNPKFMILSRGSYVYYDPEHPLWYKKPDFMVVLGVPVLYQNKDLRLSYVFWEEKVSPLLMVELLSPGTAKQDLGRFYDQVSNNSIQLELDLGFNDHEELIPNSKEKGITPKWEVYEKILKVPYYIVYSRYNGKLWFFKLVNGSYERQMIDSKNPRIWVEELGLGLGLWTGEYAQMNMTWLRWYDQSGQWVLTPQEALLLSQEQVVMAESEKQIAQQRVQEAESEKQLAKREAQEAESKLNQTVLNLYRTSMTPFQIADIVGLTIADVELIVKQTEKESL